MTQLSLSQLKGAGGGGCFVENTLIATRTSKIPIQNIKNGDLVLCYDEDLNTYEREVYDFVVHENEDVYEFIFWGGLKIQCTLIHAFVTQNNTFREIGLFTTQDFVRTIEKDLLPFKSCKYVGKRTVYNFHVKEFHTYIANDVLVHNGGGGSKSSGSSTPEYYEAPNTAQSSATARLLEMVSCGEIVGLVDGAKSIFLDETPVQNVDGSYNFSGIRWEQRTGTEYQTVIKGFEDIAESVSVGVSVTKQLSVTRRIQTTDTDAITLTISLPSGLQYMNIDANRLEGTTVQVDVHISYDNGAFIYIGRLTLSEKTNSPYEKTWYFPLEDSDTVDVRVSRVTADSTDSHMQNTTTWGSYTLLSGYKLNYPNCALMGYTVDAREFGSSLPLRYARMKGLIVDVPSNYDPENRTYSGIWDGTFKRAYTNNAAWFVWWCVTDKINGIGQDIPAWTLESLKIDLYEIAKYNDELVPDGYGRYEPRFTFNAWIVEPQNSLEFLQTVCGTMNAIIFWAGNTIKISQDSPKDIEYVFSPSNVIDGKFTYSQTPLSSMHSVALMTYNNMDDYGKAATEKVENLEMIHKIGYKALDVTILGCTSRGQAKRAGGWHLYTEQYENEVVNFKVSLQHCQVSPGNIAGIADPHRQGVDYQGRVKKVDGLELTLDRAVNLDEFVEYSILITLSNGTVQKIGIQNTNNNTDIIILTEPPHAKILNGASWVLTSTVLVPTEWRVLAIVEDTPTSFSITAMKYDRRKYDYVDYDYVFPEPPTSLVPSGPVEPPYNLKAQEYLYAQSSGVVLSAVTFSWTPKDDARVRYFEVRTKVQNTDSYSIVGTFTAFSAEIKDLLKETYILQVRAVTNMGLKSPWSSLTISLLGLALPLPDVTGLTSVYMADKQLYIAWNPISDARDFHYQIRMGSLLWETGIAIGTNKESVYPVQGENYYMVKAVYQAAESVNAAKIEIENISGAGLVKNVIATIDERKDSWDGLNPDFYVDVKNNYLYLDTSLNNFWSVDDFWFVDDFWSFDYTGETAFYAHKEDKSILLSENNVAKINFLCNYYALDRNSDFWTLQNFWSLQNFWGSIVFGVVVERQIQIRKQGIWEDWQVYYDTRDYIGDGYRFRIKVTANEELLLYITDFKVSIDVPDNLQTHTNTKIPEEGLYIPFVPKYNKQPTIVGTIVNPTGNEDFYHVNEEVTLDGVTVFIKNKQGENIEWHCNIIIQGY